MQAYCMKCHRKREMKNAKAVTLKNGRTATQGVCPVCGTKMYVIGKGVPRAGGAVTKSMTKWWLADVPADKVFRCHDGRVMKNLEELNLALSEMTEETFRYHVTAERNDFNKWVQDVIGDYELSAELQSSSKRVHASKAAADRIALLKRG